MFLALRVCKEVHMIVPRVSPQPIGYPWIIAGLCLLFTLINVQYFFKITNSERRTSQTAFQRWRPQVLELDDGKNIWKEYNWPNTPLMAMILKPFMNIHSALFGSQVWL